MFDSLNVYFRRNVKQFENFVSIKNQKSFCVLIMILQKQNNKLWH